VDDPIATALRHAQTELRRIVATNKARKARLISIAKDRLGYEEYLECRKSIDRNINVLFTKLQKKDMPKYTKKKKKVDGNGGEPCNTINGTTGTGTGGGTTTLLSNLAPSPAALGFIQDDDQRIHLNDQLKHLMETRRDWVDDIGSIFEQKEREQPGRIYGLPKESIYKGIDEEIQKLLVDPGPAVVVQDEDILRNGRGGNGGISGTSGGVIPGKAKVKGKERAGTHSLGGDEVMMDLT
jgi:transcriptional adapter 3